MMAPPAPAPTAALSQTGRSKGRRKLLTPANKATKRRRIRTISIKKPAFKAQNHLVRTPMPSMPTRALIRQERNVVRESTCLLAVGSQTSSCRILSRRSPPGNSVFAPILIDPAPKY
jgi:hypothetical protein